MSLEEDEVVDMKEEEVVVVAAASSEASRLAPWTTGVALGAISLRCEPAVPGPDPTISGLLRP
eukprot:751322-Hanusia_phi.AAC.1